MKGTFTSSSWGENYLYIHFTDRDNRLREGQWLAGGETARRFCLSLSLCLALKSLPELFFKSGIFLRWETKK